MSTPMASAGGFVCSRCGERHDELSFDYHVAAPAYWSPDQETDETSELGEDQCVVRGEHFFVRGLIRLPVLDAERDFHWGAWVSLSKENFLRMSELWDAAGREAEPPYFGWLSTVLPGYEPTTLNLRTLVHTEPLGYRPLIEIEASDHPLAAEQRDGITVARVQEIAELAHHEQEP